MVFIITASQLLIRTNRTRQSSEFLWTSRVQAPEQGPALRPEAMGVLKPGEGEREQMALQEDVMVGSEQERLLLLTSMLGVAEHDLVSAQDRLNAMHQLQLEKDEELMQKERQMGSLYDVRVPPRTDASRPQMHTEQHGPLLTGWHSRL